MFSIVPITRDEGREGKQEIEMNKPNKNQQTKTIHSFKIYLRKFTEKMLALLSQTISLFMDFDVNMIQLKRVIVDHCNLLCNRYEFTTSPFHCGGFKPIYIFSVVVVVMAKEVTALSSDVLLFYKARNSFASSEQPKAKTFHLMRSKSNTE